MGFWGVVVFVVQAVLIFALSTVLFDTLHWLLHRWGKSKIRLFRMFARWHWVHHSFLDRKLRIHPSIARKNIIYHVVPEYLTSAAGTLPFLLVFPWQPVLGALAYRTWCLADALRAGGADINHRQTERVNGRQELVRITPSYHAMHHIHPDNYYSSFFNVFDFLFGKSCQIKGRRFAITGADGAFGSALARRLAKIGAEIRALTPGVDLAGGAAGGARPTLEWADVLVLAHHDAATSFVDLIDLFAEMGRRRLAPPEVWALELKAESEGDFSSADRRSGTGPDGVFATQARTYYRSPDLLYRHIVGSNLTSFLGQRLIGAEAAISVALFFIRRGFRYFPIPYKPLVPWNYLRFRFDKRAPPGQLMPASSATGRGAVTSRVPVTSHESLERPRELTFFCVLRASKKYGPEHVARLRSAVARNCTIPHRFVALSDVPVPCERVPLLEEWPYWWSKIELFRPGVADPGGTSVYLDLDLLVTGNLDRLVSHPHSFSMARDDKFPERANGSVMAWTGDRSFIYRAMKRHPWWNMYRFQVIHGNLTGWMGDQALIEWSLRAAGTPPDRIDSFFPGWMKVFRQLPHADRDVVNEDAMRDALFVSFQGARKPGSSKLRDNAFVRRYW